MQKPGARFPDQRIQACLLPCRTGWVLLLFCLCMTSLGPGQLIGQSALLPITANFQDQPLVEVLAFLEKEQGLSFAYLDEAIAPVRVNCSFNQASWAEVVDCLFAQYGLEVSLLEDGYVTLRPGAPRDWDICLRTQSITGDILPFVTLGNANLGLSYATGADGYLQTTIRAKATDSLSLHYLGYASQRLAPSQLLSSPGCPVIELTATSIELASVTVREYLTEGISATADGRRVILDPNEVAATPGFADREVFRSLPLLPGVNNIQETASALSIRGGTPDQNLILWDNIPIYSSGHYLGMVSSFSPELIGAVDVWRGRAEAEYGGHVSGVIRMTTDREISERAAIGGGVSLLQANAFAALPLISKKSDLRVSYRGSLPSQLSWPAYDSYRAQALQGYRVGEVLEDNLARTEATETFNFGEFNGRWQFNLAPGHELTLSGFWQQDDLDYQLGIAGQTALNTDALESSNNGISFHYARQAPQGHNTELWISHADFSSLGENEYNNLLVNTLVQRESGIRESSAKMLHTASLGPRSQVQAGMQFQRYNYNFRLSSDNRLTGLLREVAVRKDKATAVSPFASYEWSSAGGFRAQLGLRLPWYGPTNQVYVEPRINGSYQFNDSWLVKAGYGANHQFPLQIIDLYQTNVSRAATIWTLADGFNFPVQSGREFTLGLSGQPKSWFFDLEFYHKRVAGLSATSLSLETSGFATGDSRATGMDLLVRKRWGDWRTWVVYSLSNTEWNFFDVADDYFPADLDRRHQLRLVQTYTSKQVTISFGWQLQSGAPFTPTDVGPTITEDGQLQVALLSGNINSRRLPVFHRADLSVTYDWPAAANKDWSGGVTLSLINLYGRDNLLERNYVIGQNSNPSPGERRFFAQPVDRLGLGFTPNISARINWR